MLLEKIEHYAHMIHLFMVDIATQIEGDDNKDNKMSPKHIIENVHKSGRFVTKTKSHDNYS